MVEAKQAIHRLAVFHVHPALKLGTRHAQNAQRHVQAGFYEYQRGHLDEIPFAGGFLQRGRDIQIARDACGNGFLDGVTAMAQRFLDGPAERCQFLRYPFCSKIMDGRPPAAASRPRGLERSASPPLAPRKSLILISSKSNSRQEFTSGECGYVSNPKSISSNCGDVVAWGI